MENIQSTRKCSQYVVYTISLTSRQRQNKYIRSGYDDAYSNTKIFLKSFTFVQVFIYLFICNVICDYL